MFMAEKLSNPDEPVRWKARRDRLDLSGLSMTPVRSYLDPRPPAVKADTRAVDLIGSVLRCTTTQVTPVGEPVWTTLFRSSLWGRPLQFELAGRVLRSSEIEGMPGCFLVQVQLDPCCREAVEGIREQRRARE